MDNSYSSELQISTSLTENNLRISITPPLPGPKKRVPTSICCVVDVSGSMDSQADSSGLVTSSEKYKLSILDICKHGLKMVVHSLSSEDSLMLVTFSTKANTVIPLIPMTDQNKAMSESKIESLQTEGSTNLWAGILQGLEGMKQSFQESDDVLNPKCNRNKWIFVFTDGQPDDKRDVYTKLNKYISQKDNINFCSVNTFAFGKDSDSQLMYDIADKYNGIFSHIPDCTQIATVFANALSNALTTQATDLKVKLTTLHGTSIKVPNCYTKLESGKDISVQLGVMNYEQKRDLIVNLPSELDPTEILKVNVSYSDLESRKGIQRKQEITVNCSELDSSEDDLNEIYRVKFVSAIQNGITNASKANEFNQIRLNLLSLAEEMEPQLSSNDRHFEGIYKDLVKTVIPSFSSEKEYNEQGKHTILSLMRAHLIQQCNTFKYPGVQHYGKAIFQAIRDVADKTFCNLPPPKPFSEKELYEQQLQILQSCQKNIQGQNNTNSSTNNNNTSASSYSYQNSNDNNYSDAYNMADYHNYGSGGCVYGDSLVLLADQITTKKASEIKKGDKVSSPGDGLNGAEIVCVVVSKLGEEGTKQQLYRLSSGLTITSKHPIKGENSGEWVYPYLVKGAEILDVDKEQKMSLETHNTIPRKSNQLYQFVLNAGHTMIIGGIECICLGHGIKEGIAQHDYLGTNRVIEDLSQMQGWKEGIVEIAGRIKDPKTNKVIKFVQQKQQQASQHQRLILTSQIEESRALNII